MAPLRSGAGPSLRVLFRADRLPRPRTALPVQRIGRADGWCDAPGDRNYNRPVRHPYPASAERLWREDALYDVVVVLGHNQRPRLRGAGSAIFMHVARPGYLPTEGCIALRRDHLLRLLDAPAARLGGGGAARSAPAIKNARSFHSGRSRSTYRGKWRARLMRRGTDGARAPPQTVYQ